jgi:D-sedoheptulose 7-phosphate isomerase
VTFNVESSGEAVNGVLKMIERETDEARNFFVKSSEIMSVAAQDGAFMRAIADISEAIVRSLMDSGKILLAGNGGSAGDAQHIAGEFLSRLNFDRAPLPALALTVDSSVLTAIGNDYGYEQVFERQIRGLGRRGDVFIAISTSGRSPNVLRGLRAARELGLVAVGFTGSHASPMLELCDFVLAAPSTSTPLIQQTHITAAHVICGWVERAMFGHGSHA